MEGVDEVHCFVGCEESSDAMGFLLLYGLAGVVGGLWVSSFA